MGQSDAHASTHILLVDDDRLVLATLATGLQQQGYRVTTADSGEPALERFREHTPDLVVLDYRMPGMTGPEVAQQMLAEAYCPIIMLSAYDDKALVDEAIKLGVSGYLVKPVDVNQLVPSIEAALARFGEVNALINSESDLREGLERSRIVSTAVGIIMARQGFASDRAYDALRRLARDERRPLRDVAADLVDATDQANRMLDRLKPAQG
ncbi:MAG: response regulator [Gammaproteobacteria bacterium]|nr:response regulator [Gammaproteobacteria bacterium]